MERKKSALSSFLSSPAGAAALAALAVGVVLIFFSGRSAESARPEQSFSSLAASVAGVGECRVYLYPETGEVRSVAIVCEGADDDRVRTDLVRLAAATFGIGTNRVTVLRSG